MENWIETKNHHKFNVFDIDPDAIDIEDIAHALSMSCRFNGHLEKFLSVAEHSVVIASMATPENALAGLLHDAAEAYITDVPKPIKVKLDNINELDESLTKAIFKKFGVEYPIPDEIKWLDKQVCFSEALDSNMRVAMWNDYDKYILSHIPFHWSPAKAKSIFLRMFDKLKRI